MSITTPRKAFKVKTPPPTVTLDFDARVPIPFSVFPSSYRSDAAVERTESSTRVKFQGDLPPSASRVGREGHEEATYSSFQASLPGRKDKAHPVYEKEEVKVYEDDRSRRPSSRREEFTVVEEDDRFHRERIPEVEVTRER